MCYTEKNLDYILNSNGACVYTLQCTVYSYVDTNSEFRIIVRRCRDYETLTILSTCLLLLKTLYMSTHIRSNVNYIIVELRYKYAISI